MCRRSDSDDVHSQRRSQASWREVSTGMDGSLAERTHTPGGAPPRQARQSAGPPEGGEVIVQRVTPRARLGTDPATSRGARSTNRPTRQATLRPPMEKFVIEGGVPLSGTITPAGNKNGALAILAACLLTEDEVVVSNVPRIRDVETMLSILTAIGVAVAWRGPNEVTLCAAGVHEVEVP